MDVFALALLVFAVLFLGGILCIGISALLQIRSGRRERLQMKKHVQRLELASWK